MLSAASANLTSVAGISRCLKLLFLRRIFAMAAALSRALKLPGKKGSELGEYDPLTQADSEDDSEEDDLVLNYPRNGLGRSNNMGLGTSDSRSNRGSRFTQQEDVDEDEEEVDEWRERHRGKSRPETEDEKCRQYWSQREMGRDATSEDGEGMRSTGGGGIGSECDPYGKKNRVKNAVRTAAFLVPLCLAMIVVLLCAFILPCQQLEDRRPQWEREQGGDAGGVTSLPLALWDVDNDGIEDILIGVTQLSNESQVPSSQAISKEYSVVALSATSGSVLWRRPLREPVISVQCGLQTGAASSAAAHPAEGAHWGQQSLSLQSGPVCLLVGSSHLTAVNGTSGTKLWSATPGAIESPVVLLPDVDGDSVPDLLIVTLPENNEADLCLVLLSALNGTHIGRPVNFNLTGQGKLIGPLLHETRMGAYYVLFGLGTVEAVSLRDIYTKASDVRVIDPKIKVKDPLWEKLRKTNSSSLIHISSGTEEVIFLLPLVAGLCNNHNNLDVMSNMNSSQSDWMVICDKSRLSVLKEKDTRTAWTFNSSAIHSRPTPGQFNGDGIPDVLIQLSAAGVRKVQIIDGGNGHSLWEAEFVCPRLVLEGSSVMTTSGQSVFLFWAGDPLKPQKNITKASSALAPTDPVVRKLFMLHPNYPIILLELASTTDTILTAAVSYEEQWKDAAYITVFSRPTSGLGPGTRMVKSLSLKAAVAGALIVRLGEESQAGAPVRLRAFEIKKFFKQLSFKHQVRDNS
ncbi:protein FAM234B isoform X1 [Alosa alosa]|uniref:protein FAM234B isoform X1 n=1 Tax=Alosa alosa TaxID=278164 RepID=UPI0020152A07|nr:protein FAM234B isoform X1 [Alosa alosa]